MFVIAFDCLTTNSERTLNNPVFNLDYFKFM